MGNVCVCSKKRITYKPKGTYSIIKINITRKGPSHYCDVVASITRTVALISNTQVGMCRCEEQYISKIPVILISTQSKLFYPILSQSHPLILPENFPNKALQ